MFDSAIDVSLQGLYEFIASEVKLAKYETRGTGMTLLFSNDCPI